jgi:hypothetical protein
MPSLATGPLDFRNASRICPADHHRLGALSRHQDPGDPHHQADGSSLARRTHVGGWTAKEIHQAILTTFDLSGRRNARRDSSPTIKGAITQRAPSLSSMSRGASARSNERGHCNYSRRSPSFQQNRRPSQHQLDGEVYVAGMGPTLLKPIIQRAIGAVQPLRGREALHRTNRPTITQ